MIVVACICWFDEHPDMLRTCVMSLEGVADAIVSADGPFAAHPHKGEESPREQSLALQIAAADAGLPLIQLPSQVWDTQIVKRTTLVRFAARMKYPHDSPDWLLVIDSDERIAHPVHPRFRKRLEQLPEQRQVVLIQGDRRSYVPRLLRADPEIRYQDAHNRIFIGDTMIVDGSPQVRAENMAGFLGIEHDRQLRDRNRLKRSNIYRLERRKIGER